MLLKVKPDKESVYGTYAAPREFGLGREVKDEVLYNFIDTCRETFLRHISGNSLTNQWVIYYARSVANAEKTKKFIEACEKKLIKSKYNRSQIHAVGMKLCILPAEFWKKKFRLGLLTILIRAGSSYKEGNSIEKYIYASPYVQTEGMIAAVKSFFKGYTEYSHKPDPSLASGGFWLDEFDGLDAESAKSRLQKA